MMMHRHFEDGNQDEDMTKLSDVTANARRSGRTLEEDMDEFRSRGTYYNETPRRGRPRKAD